MPDLVKFAHEMAELFFDFEGMDPDAEEVHAALVDNGIIHFRKPTAEELADPEWWGHEHGIKEDDEGVGDITPEMRAMIQKADEAAA